MPRYRLRTLLILLALLPPLLWFGWTKYEAWRAEQAQQRILGTQSDLMSGYESNTSIIPYDPSTPPPKSPPPLRRPAGE